MPPLTILYAEDNRALLLNMAEMLEDEGWRVDVCEDGEAARQKIESPQHYDLLLLDHDLPGMSGLDLVRLARSLPGRQHTPIILISATELGREAHRVGADLFVKKPENIYAIVEHIVKLTTQT